MAKFIIKNEENINRQKVSEVVIADDNLCKALIEELFIEKVDYNEEEKDKIEEKYKDNL